LPGRIADARTMPAACRLRAGGGEPRRAGARWRQAVTCPELLQPIAALAVS